MGDGGVRALQQSGRMSDMVVPLRPSLKILGGGGTMCFQFNRQPRVLVIGHTAVFF
jgi:hypothetical protein